MSNLTQIGTRQKPKSSFDSHHPPDKDLLADCVHCGFCLPACPTYVLWGEEMDSPRGRIYMMAKANQGEAPLDLRFREHMDHCLGCMACMTACPSGVQYNKLIEDTRAQIERNIPRSSSDSFFREALYAIFPHAHRLRILALPLFAYQRLGIQRLLRSLGILSLLPSRLRAMDDLLPTVPSSLFRKLPVFTPAHTASGTSAIRRQRVGMLIGCVQQVFFQHVNDATRRVLAAEGYDVIIAAQNSCCGALQVHSGEECGAQDFARKMIAAFEAADVDYVVINAAGCGSTMKEYEYILRDDPEWVDRAKSFAAKCKDISEILSFHPAWQTRHPIPLRVAYQDACHLRHAQGIYLQPRALLGEIPSLEVVEIAEANMCCGSAGIYNLVHPETAAELGDRKVANLLATKAQAVISANPGCLLQLQSGLRRKGLAEMPTFHMIELIDASIRGCSVDELLHH